LKLKIQHISGSSNWVGSELQFKRVFTWMATNVQMWWNIEIRFSYWQLQSSKDGWCPELKKIMPEYIEGQCHMIIQYHDKSCFHANDDARNLLLCASEQPLWKKGRGRLIHVSDFINEEDGRLVLLDADGKIIEDARVIIYLGSNGDPWWDTKQLLAQIKTAIQIFNKSHSDCQAPFVLDQSSAHTSLSPDAFKAFEMNKSNGGKQHKQRDTIIPESNLDACYRGQPQSMTTELGEPKGLQSILE
jgi:hypothetical protein